MAKYRVYELADRLGMESAQLIDMLHQMGVRVKSHMSSVDEGDAARLHARLERERRGGAQDDSSGSSRRRRRRRRAEPAPIAEGAVTAVEVAEDEEQAEELEVPLPAEAAEAEDVEETVVAPVGEAPPEFEEPETTATVAGAEERPAAEAPPAEQEEGAAPAPAEEGVAPAPAKAAARAKAPQQEPDVEQRREPEEEAEAEEERPAAEARPAEPEEEKETRTRRRPKPVRRGLGQPAAPTAGPAASAGPGGTVRIQAEGYTVDGRRRSRREKKRQRRVDQKTVKENVEQTLAAMKGGGTRRKRRDTGPSEQETAELEREEEERQKEKTRVRVNEFLTVSELADQIGVSAHEIITSAFKNLGLMVTINQRLDFDQIELICEEFGFEAVREQSYGADIPGLEAAVPTEGLVSRAPVVTVMGHVDHGKTSLLDYIRKTNVIAGEAGSITQHIGAYHVEVGDGRAVTFLDTPGHEAFTAMRARGAEITDIVVLVIAADDAVMPQTVEAISHARNAGVPMVVAINKVDLPTADVGRVKQDLLSHEVVLEEFGGDVLSAPVSARSGSGVEDLLEKLLLQAELLELKAGGDGPARGTVVEAELDRGMGPVATILVQSGRLSVGDDFLVGVHAGRVRALLDERGNSVEGAGPSNPVRVLGMEGVPQAGDTLIVLDAARAKELATRRQQLEREKDIRRRARGTRLEDVFERIQAGEQAHLNLVIKGDTDGSVQALSDSLERLSTGEVAVQVIHRGVGAVSESDVLLATTAQASVIGFHVRPDTKARAVAERESVDVRTYDVIYEAVEDVRLALEGLLAPEEREVTAGAAEVRQLFRVPRAGTVAGCYVISGVIQRNLPVRLLRDHVQIYEGRIDSLRRFKDDVREVREGYECGISIEGYNDIKVGDTIECYRVEEIERTLAESSAAG